MGLVIGFLAQQSFPAGPQDAQHLGVGSVPRSVAEQDNQVSEVVRQMQSSPAALFHIDAPIQESGRIGRAAGGHDVARIVELHVHRQFAGPRQLNRLAPFAISHYGADSAWRIELPNDGLGAGAFVGYLGQAVRNRLRPAAGSTSTARPQFR